MTVKAVGSREFAETKFYVHASEPYRSGIAAADASEAAVTAVIDLAHYDAPGSLLENTHQQATVQNPGAIDVYVWVEAPAGATWTLQIWLEGPGGVWHYYTQEASSGPHGSQYFHIADLPPTNMKLVFSALSTGPAAIYVSRSA